jgi:hypothetical protein
MRWSQSATAAGAAAELVGRHRHRRVHVTALGGDTCVYRTNEDSLTRPAVRAGMLGNRLPSHGPPQLIERFGRSPRGFNAASQVSRQASLVARANMTVWPSEILEIADSLTPQRQP